MNIDARLASLAQASRELETEHIALSHRIELLAQGVQELASLQAGLLEAKTREARAREELRVIRERLPIIARKESLARVQERLDHEPFETYVNSSALRSKQ